ARLAPLFPGDPIEDTIWGERHDWGSRADPQPDASDGDAAGLSALPDWVLRPVGPEPRPPRPFAPSSAGEEQGADPPLPSDAMMLAARRGVLVHKLLERLPDVPVAQRADSARTWLARNAADVAEEHREELLQSALTVLADDRWADL